MIESWRWFGPLDKITPREIEQTGAIGVVNALHEIPYGEVWTRAAIAERKGMIEGNSAQLKWNVVESLPVHEDIKRGAGDLDTLFANYITSLENLAAEGIHTVCYNFMPLLDWTRTDLEAPLPRGGSALRYDAVKMAAFDIHMLQREGAENDHAEAVKAPAKAWFDASDQAQRDTLLTAIMAGLPGAYARYTIEGLREALAPWAEIDAQTLRENYRRFLEAVIPASEKLGIRMCVHPDDPPRPLLGLPRIVSNEADIEAILSMVDSPANGLTLCTGSLGANPVNDVPAIARRFADRIHFAHLRNVRKETDGSFQEDAHLDGDTDLPAVIDALLEEEDRRAAQGREDQQIPMRPDHGHELLEDIGRGTHPGYPLIGRLRGLAELRGVIAGIRYARTSK